MAYNKSAAYDLSLFDDDNAYVSSSAAPARKQDADKTPQRTAKKSTANKVVELPEDEIHKIRRRKRNPAKLIFGSAIGSVVAVVIGIIIVGQVQLTELNQEIITAEKTLANAQSVYTENQMKVESNLSRSSIEEYAEKQLGMTKATNTQKEFVNLSGGDKVEVSSHDNENLFTQFIDSIKNLWS